MMKKLLPLLFLLGASSCQATGWFSSSKEPSKLEKCITSTAVLLGTLSTINSLKDKECTKNSIDALKVLQKELDNTQAAKELYEAIAHKRYKEAIELLTKKPDLHINNGFGEYNITALMDCCCKGDSSLNVVKEILKHPKLDITIKNYAGANYLHYACNWVVPEITKLLLTRGDINHLLNAKTNKGATPLDYTFQHIEHSKGKMDDITIWNMMVNKGAQLNYVKQQYKQLDSKKFKSPHNKYVDTIKANPPKEIKGKYK